MELVPGRRLTVLFGNNAQGKTNTLEAAYFLSNLQSFRTHRVRDLVAFSGRESRVSGQVESRLGTTRMDVSVNSRGRTPRVDGKVPESLGSYLGAFRTVLFCPQDLDLARGNQELRRRYLDRATFLSDPSHLGRLRQYQRVLKQRNALLKSGQEGISVWDERLAEIGASVHDARVRTLVQLGPVVTTIHAFLSDSREKPSLSYESGFSGEDVREVLLRRLREGRERDERLGFTNSGPHRDRLVVRIGAGEIERYGSQGQMRSLALSLKLALLRWGAEVGGEDPVFLLDDPGSELDPKRLSLLGEFLDGWTGQVIVTSTRADAIPFPHPVDRKTFRVEGGRLVESGRE